MSGNNLSVKVTADVADLTSKFAIAKAEVSNLSSEMNKLARASVNGGLDATASARLQQVAGDFVHAKTTAAGLADQLKVVKESSAGAGGALEGVRAGISRAFAITGIAAAGEAVMKVGEAIESLGERAIQIRSMSAVLGVSTTEFQAMQVAAEEAGVSAEVFARAGEKLTNILEEARNGSGKAVEKLHALGVTTADIANPTFQLNSVLAVLKQRLEDTSSAEQTRKALLQELGARTALAIVAIKEYDGSSQGQAAAMSRVNGLMPEQIDRLKEMKTFWGEVGTSVANASGKLLIYAADAVKAYGTAELAMTNMGENGAPTPSGPGRSTSSTGEQRAAQESARAQATAHAEALHDEMEKIKEGVAAFATGTAERLAALRQYAADAKQFYGAGNVDEVRKANSDVLAAEREYHATQSREAIGEAKEEAQAVMANTNLSLSQRLEAERSIWSSVLSNDRVGAAQRIEAAREFSREYTEIAKQTAAQVAAIARSDADTDISISRIQLQAQRSALEAQVQATQISASQKLAIMRELAAQEFSLDLQSLQMELKGLQAGTAEYERVYNQIRVLKAKLTADLEGYDSQYQRDAARLLKEQSAQWKSAVGEIENAEGSLVSNLLNKRQSLWQSLRQIGAQMVTTEITNDLKAFTTKQLLQDREKALEQGGFLYHQVVQAQAAATTAQSQTIQTAAVETGNAARTSATISAAASARAAGAATNGATVMADAAKAFSGTYSSVAQIPYVGWILAPAAAAAAFAAVAAYEGLASLDVGTNYVPHDMTARIHQGEAVVPKRFNPAAGGSGGGGGGDVHIHQNLSAFDASSMSQLMNSSAFHDGLAAAVGRYINRGGRG